jgi:hypothetical protein
MARCLPKRLLLMRPRRGCIRMCSGPAVHSICLATENQARVLGDVTPAGNALTFSELTNRDSRARLRFIGGLSPPFEQADEIICSSGIIL